MTDIGATVTMTAGAGCFAEGIRRMHRRYEQIEPSATDIDTVRQSSLFTSVTVPPFDDLYAQARIRAQENYAGQMVVMGLSALALIYGAYRSMRRVFR